MYTQSNTQQDHPITANRFDGAGHVTAREQKLTRAVFDCRAGATYFLAARTATASETRAGKRLAQKGSRCVLREKAHGLRTNAAIGQPF